mgnify:CR=1 FL=1
MSINLFGSMFFEETTILLVFLVMSKLLFEESIIADRKSITFLIIAAALETFLGLIGRTSGISIYSKISNFITLISMCVYIRGDKKRILHRIRAVIDTFLIYIMSIAFYCGIVFSMVKPSLADEFKYLDTNSFSIMVAVSNVVVIIYLYFELARKGICLKFRCRERVLMILFSLMVCIVAGVFDALSESYKMSVLPKEYRYLFVGCISIVYIVTPLFMIKNKLSIHYEMGQKHQQELLELQLQHFERYKEAQEETRRFRHDMINHLITVQMLQQEEKYDEANAYVDELLGRVSVLSPKVVTGSDLLDCIVTSKIEIMEQDHILYEIDGVLDQGLKMSPVDICAVFSNALDNAIEALQKVDKERRFYMRLKRTNTYYMITMQNTIVHTDDPKSILQKNRFTTKKNKELHGYGMQNMRKTIEKYGGEITAEIEDGEFILTILLPIDMDEN